MVWRSKDKKCIFTRVKIHFFDRLKSKPLVKLVVLIRDLQINFGSQLNMEVTGKSSEVCKCENLTVCLL